MGSRTGSLARVYRRLEGTLHPRQRQRQRQRMLPSTFNLQCTFIAPGALRSQHHEVGGTASERVRKLRSAVDIAPADSKLFDRYLSGGTATIAGAARSISHTVLSGVALQSFKATRALKVKEHPYGMECRRSFVARSFSSDTNALPSITDPDVKQAIKNLLASSWDELRDSIKSDVMYALSKKTDDTVGQEALANAWRAAEAVEQFGGVLLSLRMELDELSGSSGENVRPLSDELQGALRAAYKRYNTYLDAFGPDEAYLRKKVEIELGTKMIHIKMRCSGLDSEWGKITALGTSGLSGSYIEHRAA